MPRLANVVFLAALPGLAQNTEIESLKSEVKKLEQMMAELKKRLDAAEARETAVVAPLPVAATAPAPPPHQVPPPASPERFMGGAVQRRQTAGQNEVTVARVRNESIDPQLRGFLRFPGTGTLFRPGGYIKTDVFLDLNYAGSFYGAYVPSLFPSAPQPKSFNSTVSMRPSRITQELRQPSVYGEDVKAFFEADFLGEPTRNSLQLRHFYGQWKGVLVGQTWSAFADADTFPDTLEFEGPPGTIALRIPQFRYTHALGRGQSVGVSVEKSGVDVPFDTPFGAPIGIAKRPDLVFFHRFEGELGHLQSAVISRSVGGLIPNTDNPNLQGSREGYGVSLSGIWQLGPLTRDNIVFQGSIGRGITALYNDNFSLGTDVGFAADGRLVATPSGSFHVGYQHHWNRILRSTVSYAELRINNTAGAPPDQYSKSRYATIGLIAQPTPSVLFGAEYIYGSLERKNNFKWIAPRFQISATYYLNKYLR